MRTPGSRKIKAARYSLEHPELTEAEAARRCDVGEREMRRAKYILGHGISGLVALAESDCIPFTVADRIAHQTRESQKFLLDTYSPAELGQVVPRPPDERPGDGERVGRGNVGAKYRMMHHIERTGFRDVQMVADEWDKLRDWVPELPERELDWFLAELKKSRTATSRLIRLIEEARKQG